MRNMGNILCNPPEKYRCLPFWSWNDKLEPCELKEQIRMMKDAGIGGFFMHARGGLQTPYMSDEWMAAIDVCVEEAQKYGMEPWLYDEEGWPSGFAGGEVTKLGDKYHTRWLECIKCPAADIAWDQSVLGVYSGKFEFLGRDKNTVLGNGVEEEVYVVVHKSNPYYVDVLNADVIRKFIELTHEKYKNIFGEKIGSLIPGFFTDEPQYSKMVIPYSYLLPEYFEKENGYDLIPKLISVFAEAPGYQRIRHDFWKTVSHMFTEGFCKTIYEWCNENHCKLTGHLMREDSLLLQMHATAGVMPSYEYMHMPGIDWLRRRISSPLTPKQAGSAAAQMGKKFVISEMFAMAGWDCSPRELKWIAQWQYVNGVNKMCQHLEAYSIRGIRKRDFPPSLFYQQPWWEEYKLFNDYFARLGVLLSEGRDMTEVLLLHPMHSAWILYDARNNEEIKRFGDKFERLSQTLSDLHILHHYGDETLLGKYGSTAGKQFCVGSCRYNVVLIPDMIYMEGKTIELLMEYARSGGKIHALGEFPELTDNNCQDKLNELRKLVPYLSPAGLKAMIDPSLEFTVSVTENNEEIEGLHCCRRQLEDKTILYFTNLNQDRVCNSLIRVSGDWNVQEYDLLNNSYSDIELNLCSNGITEFKAWFGEMDSKVYILVPRAADEENEYSKQTKKDDSILLESGGRFELVNSSLNAMTLDYCGYRIENEEWKPKTNTIKLMDILLAKRENVNLELRFNFEILADPKVFKEFYLVSEQKEKISAQINGQSVEFNQKGWWLDKGFAKYDIHSYLKQGNNEIILKVFFEQPQKVYDVLFGENVLETEKNKLTFNTEIESIYLLGDFGVYNHDSFSYSWRKEIIANDNFYLDQKPDYLYGDDFTTQGFCFFSGKLEMKQEVILHEYDDSQGVQIKSVEGKRVIYKFKRPNAAVAKLFINDHLVTTIFWQVCECDITDYVRFGVNEIRWELYSSNRNLLGPHHHTDGELYAVWPADFTETPSPFKEDKRNVWSDAYHFVKFGM
ncbi:MAG TPA: hypothetical protein GXX75_14620 [Clostridiales bacterium]|nr:hypothetical protein [Clostridiales bacterium]